MLWSHKIIRRFLRGPGGTKGQELIRQEPVRQEESMMMVLGLMIAALGAYLVYALVNPEKL